uniref:NADH-ubiquinone oxidoreductase chain 4 n=1 Tax=Paralepetopsis sp. TaxID=3071116 RepID=A0AA96KHR2_9GAST|nr:NADH dehydrogenase subunit 4 [Paralepetopsis sp.]
MKTNSLSLTSSPLSTALISLTWWISFLMMLASQKSVFVKKNKQENFSFLVVLLNLVLTMTFSATGMFWFYVFFELSLIPTLLLILGWGYQPERLQAGMFMLMYTITASLPFLATLFYNNIPLNKHIIFLLNQNTQLWHYNMFILFSILAFMVKLPVYTTHLWLPKAHVEAPVAGSMILAGILLKLGGFGMIQTFLFFKTYSCMMSTVLMTLGLWGGMITSIVCIRQTDLKALIAYSSVAHMSFVFAGILSMSSWGWSAAFMMMVSHGLCSSAMFCLSNMLYEKIHSRSMLIPKGMLALTPSFALWWFLLCSANIPTPPSITLVSEILAIPAIIHFSLLLTLIIAIMGMMSAAYNLLVYASTQHGATSKTTTPFFSPNKVQHKIFLLHLAPLMILTVSMTKIIF